jgi:hypothetical protein
LLCHGKASPPSDRDLQLKAVLAELAEQQRLLRAQRQQVIAAKNALAALCKCNGCGGQVPPAMGADAFCWPCARKKIEDKRKASKAVLNAG